jgi:hypothetical protein
LENKILKIAINTVGKTSAVRIWDSLLFSMISMKLSGKEKWQTWIIHKEN